MMGRSGSLAIAFWVSVVLLGSVVPNAQGQNGASITGYALDQTGAVIPGVRVTVTNEETGTAQTVSTNGSGLFFTSNLSPGSYQITGEQNGFEKIVKSHLEVNLNQQIRSDLTFAPGHATESVEVRAQVSALQSEDATISTVIHQEDVASLPLFNRRPGYLLILVPGVRFTGEDELSFGSPRFVSGGIANGSFVINGAPANQNRVSEAQMAINPPLDSVQEVTVDTSGASIQYGWESGPVMTIETKSGTNNFHGSLYDNARNEALDTYNGFTNTKPTDRYELFGGTVGGRIIRNKLFFFASLEGNLEANPAAQLFTVPTEAMLQGDFSNLRDANGNVIPIYDPSTTCGEYGNPACAIGPNGPIVTRQQFLGNIIPSSRFDTVAKNLIAFPSFSDPNLSGTVAGANNLSATYDNIFNAYRHAIKLDWSPTTKDTISLTVLFEQHVFGVTEPREWTASPVTNPLQNQTQHRTQSYIASWSRVLSPTLENEFTWSYRPQRTRRGQTGLGCAQKFAKMSNTLPRCDLAHMYAQELGILNYTPDDDLGFPSFSFQNYAQVGPTFLIDNFEPVHEMTVMNTTTMVWRNHVIKFGGMGNFDHDQGLNDSSPTGAFSFADVETGLPGIADSGNDFASFLLGQVDSAGLTSDQPFIAVQKYMGFFGGDSWKITHKLTLNLGLRWDVDFPLYEDYNNQISFFDPTAINPVSGTPGALAFAGRNGQPRGLWATDWHRFAPRLGVAYQLTPKTVIRAGYGVFGIRPPLTEGQEPSIGFSYVNAGFTSPDTGITPAFVLDQGFPEYQVGGTPATLVPGFGAVPPGNYPNLDVQYFDRRMIFGSLRNMSVSVQRELPGSILFEVAGLGNLGRHLPVGVDWNQVPRAYWGQLGNVIQYTPYPQYSDVFQLGAMRGLMNYFGLTLKGQKKFGHGLSFMTNFTWQKSLGLTGGYTGSFINAPYVEATAYPNLSYGPTVFGAGGNGPTAAPYKLGTVSWTYELPWGHGRPWLTSGLASKIMGGWQTSAVISFAGGIPFNLTNSSSSLNCNCPLGFRVNSTGHLNSGPKSLDEWFNTSAVTAPGYGTIGNVGPGVVVGPGADVSNLAVAKNISVNDRIRVTLDGEFFNLFNHRLFANPGSTFGSPGFGVVSSPGPDSPGANVSPIWGAARIVQVGLKVQF
jgi:hypothetical protein